MTVFWHEFSYKQVFKAFSLSIRFFIRTRLIEQASKTVRRKKILRIRINPQEPL